MAERRGNWFSRVTLLLPVILSKPHVIMLVFANWLAENTAKQNTLSAVIFAFLAIHSLFFCLSIKPVTSIVPALFNRLTIA